MVGRAAGLDEVVISDLDHDDDVADECVRASVEFSTEGRELDRFGLERAVREQIFRLRVRHYFIGLVKSPARSFCGTCLNEYFVRDGRRSNTQMMS